ncbi:MAG: protein kinase [Bryobacteraceae bacterium]
MNPARIGGYDILSELGRGTMGVVYHAHDSAIGRPVAIKVIRIDSGTTAHESVQLRQRLIREASVAGKIYHPGIVTVHQLGEDGDNIFIVMEFVEGASLEHLLGNNPKLDRAWTLDILAQIAVALDYAHKTGVVHRDIKPANILVRNDGRVKIADFGIAKMTSSATAMTGTGVSIGSPAYMSPEQIQAAQIDGRSDQFALSAIAFLMLTSRMPFKGATAHTLMYQIVMGDPFEPTHGDVPISQGVRAVLARGLAKNPKDRYPDCTTLIQELTAAVGVRTTISQASTVQMTAPQPTLAPPPAPAPPPTSTYAPPPEPPPAAPIFATARQPVREAVSEAVPDAVPSPAQPRKESKSWMLFPIVGGLLAVLLIGAGIYWWYSSRSAQPSPDKVVNGENKPAPTGATPLLTAIAAGDLDRVKSLLAKGADVNAVSADGTTPLMLASETSAPIVDALLAAGAQVESMDTRGRSALYRASAEGKEDAMRLLLDHQANVNSRATDLSTPLIEAVANGKLGAAQLLLDRGADVNLSDSNNTTPLMVAAEKAPAEVVKLLLTHGAKRGAKDSRGRIAFQIAVESKNAAAVQLLR